MKPKAYGKIMLFHKTALMTVNNPFKSKLPLILQQKNPTLLTEPRHNIKHLNKNFILFIKIKKNLKS